MIYMYGWYKENNKLKDNEGRIVIYGDKIMIGYSPNMTHSYLKKSIISKYKLKDGLDYIRLFFTHEDERIVFTPYDDIDDELIHKNWEYNKVLLKNNTL